MLSSLRIHSRSIIRIFPRGKSTFGVKSRTTGSSNLRPISGSTSTGPILGSTAGFSALVEVAFLITSSRFTSLPASASRRAFAALYSASLSSYQFCAILKSSSFLIYSSLRASTSNKSLPASNSIPLSIKALKIPANASVSASAACQLSIFTPRWFARGPSEKLLRPFGDLG